METKTNEARINEIIAGHLQANPEDLKAETTIKDDLGGDSLDVVEIVIQLEREFDCTIKDEIFSELTTVGKFYETIKNLI